MLFLTGASGKPFNGPLAVFYSPNIENGCLISLDQHPAPVAENSPTDISRKFEDSN